MKALVDVPFDGGSPRGGSREAPSAIRRELETHRPGVASLYSLHEDLDEDGWSFLDRRRLAQRIPHAWRQETMPVFLGGCHSISYYAITAALDRFGDLAVVVLDAHTDASLGRGEFISHGNFMRNLCRRARFPLVAIGIRGDEVKLRDLGATVVPAKTFEVDGLALAQELVASFAGRPIYLSVDVDCLDPAYCPGVNYPVAGGLTPTEVLALVATTAEGGLVGADIVEYVPRRDDGRGLAVVTDILAVLGEARERTLRAPRPRPRLNSAGGDEALKTLTSLQYHAPLRALRQRCQLVDPATTWLCEYAAAAGPTLVGVGNTEALSRAEDMAPHIVVGGPCVYHLAGDSPPTLRELLDVVTPIDLAVHLGAKCVLWFELDESYVTSTGSLKLGERDVRDAQRPVEPLVRFALLYAESRGFSAADLHVVLNTEPRVRAIVDDYYERHATLLPDAALDGLYSANGESQFPSGAAKAMSYRLVFRRSIMTYLPSCIQEVIGEDVGAVVVAENLDQAGAVARAREICAAIGENRPIALMASLPAPNAAGSAMLRGKKIDRLEPTALRSALDRLAGAPPSVRDFYAHALVGVDDEQTAAWQRTVVLLDELYRVAAAQVGGGWQTARRTTFEEMAV